MFNKEATKTILTTLFIIACLGLWITIQLFPEFPMNM
jgi:hypothetical protein